MNVWNRDRDGNIFEYEGGEDYFNQTYKLKHQIEDKEELEKDRQTENQIEQEQINKF
jgi:hypothetical protein